MLTEMAIIITIITIITMEGASGEARVGLAEAGKVSSTRTLYGALLPASLNHRG